MCHRKLLCGASRANGIDLTLEITRSRATASIARFDDNAAADRSEAAQTNVRGTQRVQLMTQVLGFDVEDSADRIEGEEIMLTPSVDPLPHFIARSLMGTAAGSRGQYVAPDRIFQYRE